MYKELVRALKITSYRNPFKFLTDGLSYPTELQNPNHPGKKDIEVFIKKAQSVSFNISLPKGITFVKDSK